MKCIPRARTLSEGHDSTEMLCTCWPLAWPAVQLFSLLRIDNLFLLLPAAPPWRRGILKWQIMGSVSRRVVIFGEEKKRKTTLAPPGKKLSQRIFFSKRR